MIITIIAAALFVVLLLVPVQEREVRVPAYQPIDEENLADEEQAAAFSAASATNDFDPFLDEDFVPPPTVPCKRCGRETIFIECKLCYGCDVIVRQEQKAKEAAEAEAEEIADHYDSDRYYDVADALFSGRSEQYRVVQIIVSEDGDSYRLLHEEEDDINGYTYQIFESLEAWHAEPHLNWWMAIYFPTAEGAATFISEQIANDQNAFIYDDQVNQQIAFLLAD